MKYSTTWLQTQAGQFPRKQKATLDTASAADWESAIRDAVEAVTGLAVCDADDTIYSAVGGNCATNCNLKYGAAAGTCTTIKSGDAAWKDKYADRAVEAAGWSNVHVVSAEYAACDYSPEVGAGRGPSPRPGRRSPRRRACRRPADGGGVATAAPRTSRRTSGPASRRACRRRRRARCRRCALDRADVCTWAPPQVPTPVPAPKPTSVPTRSSAKPTFKPTPKSQWATPARRRRRQPAADEPSRQVPEPAPTAPPSAAPTSFPSLTPTASQAPTRKGSITWAHVGEDVEVRGLGMHKFTANADNSVMFFFAGYHDDCDDGARAAKMAADPPTNDAAWNNASYCLYPNGNGLGAGRWPPDCWPTYDKKGKCSNQDRECDVAEDCNRKAWWRAKYGIGECLAPHFDVDLTFYQKKDDGTSALVRTENHISYTPYLNVSWHLDGQADGLYYFVATDSTCGVTSTSPDVFLTSSQAPTPRPSDQPTSVPTAAPRPRPRPALARADGAGPLGGDDRLEPPGRRGHEVRRRRRDPEKDDVLAFDGGDGVTVDMAVAFTGQDESAKVTVKLCKDGGRGLVAHDGDRRR